MYIVSGQDITDTYHDGKIIGGMSTDVSIYPYQLSLQYFGLHSCGASLISPTWVLTAAHCIKGTYTPLLSVRAGATSKEDGGIIVTVKNKYVHPNFKTSTIDYDIGLLELSESMDPDYAETIPLPPEGVTIKEGDMGTVTGWGSTTEDGAMVSQLRVTEIPVLNQNHCKRVIGKTLTNRMFCAGYVRGGKDACQGDSGGPFIVDGMQMGIVSWGYGCGKPQKPGVYTNIPVVRNYIKSIAGI
ncbi:unnamed protein product [Psylliodes chrysocephalus]|uniref:Peptidase S1 domain-containing protein n=1 Tax=Psylliodes chrysocephalus TaxID=3402493 RepID=A0A9P0CJ06_9CUCU|nr:unnamed protein product [Psylliodes chrysocephala]